MQLLSANGHCYRLQGWKFGSWGFRPYAIPSDPAQVDAAINPGNSGGHKSGHSSSMKLCVSDGITTIATTTVYLAVNRIVVVILAFCHVIFEAFVFVCIFLSLFYSDTFHFLMALPLQHRRAPPWCHCCTFVFSCTQHSNTVLAPWCASILLLYRANAGAFPFLGRSAMLRCRSSCTLDLLTLNQMVQGSSAVCVAKGKVAARDLWVLGCYCFQL